MNHLLFLNQLSEQNIAINPAKVLLYLKDNPESQQRDMVKPLKINRVVLSQCCRMLMHQRLLIQTGPYTAKKHILTESGLELVEKIKNGTLTGS